MDVPSKGKGTGTADSMDQLSAALGGPEAGPWAALRPDVEARVLSAGEVLFREGDPSDAMYVVVRGELKATVANAQRAEVLIGCIGPGEPVGEMQILSGGTRTATITAITETELARVPRLAVERLARDTPDAMRQLTDAIRRRARRNQLAAILPSLFGVLDESMIREVEARVVWVALPRGSTLFEQGEPGDNACILVSGRLQVSVRDAAGGEKVVDEMVRGEIVGEMTLFTGEPRSARVRALRDSELVSLDRPAIEQLIAKHPQMLMALTRLEIERLRRARSGMRPERPVRSFAVIAAGPGVPLSEFTHRLVAALGELGTTLHVGAADLDRHLGTPGLAQTPLEDPRGARIASWIDEQEIQRRFIILEADAAASPWSARCVRQADRLLVVGRAGDDPTPGAAEQALAGPDGASTRVPTSLVLLHPANTRLPSGTKRWLETRRLLRHHHVRDGNEADVARVARFMAGRAVGIALSGGGARGFAHVGVLEALKEARIPVDMIGGTSMGAFIAAESALGWDGATMARQNQALFGGWWSDLTFPVLSILGGRRTGARLRASMGDVQIEDLWLPYFCVSSNLSRAEMMVHRAGSLWRTLRASVSLPGILPPVVFEGDLLVDGSLLRNLPADVMRELSGGGTTIAVDVSAERDMQHGYPYEDAISGWRILWSRFRPFAHPLPVPSMAAVLQRSAELASVAMQREALPRGLDLYIRVPVEQFGMLDFHRASEITAAGRCVAREKLAGWSAARERRVPVVHTEAR